MVSMMDLKVLKSWCIEVAACLKSIDLKQLIKLECLLFFYFDILVDINNVMYVAHKLQINLTLKKAYY